MAEYSKISWTDATYNPWWGCAKVSPGCVHCYAETLDERTHGGKHWGAGAPRLRMKEGYRNKPRQWNGVGYMECNTCKWRGLPSATIALRPMEIQTDLFGGSVKNDLKVPDGEGMGCPNCGEYECFPARRRVFCASMADVFDAEVDPEWRLELGNLIEETPNLDWLLLTKRIEHWKEMFQQMGWTDLRAPANVWMGTSVEDQKRANERIPVLLEIPALVRWLSIEPLIGPVSIFEVLDNSRAIWDNPWSKLHWMVVGGESGVDCRPMDLDWARNIRDEIAPFAHIAYHFKQIGGVRNKQKELKDFPEDLRIRDYPTPEAAYHG